MDPTLIAAVIGATGGLVVWVLNWLWTLYANRKTAKRIRTMLNIEIDENLAALDGFRRAADSKVTLPNAAAMADMQRCDSLIQTALPNCARRIWESLTASLPVALTEQNIGSVHRFYARLDELAELQGLARGDTGQRGPFTQELDAILQQGNPLR